MFSHLSQPSTILTASMTVVSRWPWQYWLTFSSFFLIASGSMIVLLRLPLSYPLNHITTYCENVISSKKSCWQVILATSNVCCACDRMICTNINIALVRSSRAFTITSLGFYRPVFHPVLFYHEACVEFFNCPWWREATRGEHVHTGERPVGRSVRSQCQ